MYPDVVENVVQLVYSYTRPGLMIGNSPAEKMGITEQIKLSSSLRRGRCILYGIYANYGKLKSRKKPKGKYDKMLTMIEL